ncbi:hypothetical protein ACFLYB_02250 [Chloroflexota bacterium]
MSMRGCPRRILKNTLFLSILLILAIIILLPACGSETVTLSTSDIPTTSSTVVLPTTTIIPTGVEGSDLLPENAPAALHFLPPGICFQCHVVPPGHDGEVLDQFGCNRCHIPGSTIVPSTTPTVTLEITPLN